MLLQSVKATGDDALNANQFFAYLGSAKLILGYEMRLPPLNALRAFEAAARHESYIGASAELNITRGAISRHVKILEEHLGVQLFVRRAQGVHLTEAGQQFLPVLSQAFRQIKEEAARLQLHATDLRIICPPATSIRWLIPHLDGFRARHPDIRVRLTTEFYGEVGFNNLDYDLGFSVDYWPTRPPEIITLQLFPSRLTPACAPSLLAKIGPVRTISDLKKADFLHETPRHEDWRSWINAFAQDQLDPMSGIEFPNFDMASRAATLGAGFVMGDLVLCKEEFESGALVAPLSDMVCDAEYGGVCLIGSPEKWNDPKVVAFREWAAEVASHDT